MSCIAYRPFVSVGVEENSTRRPLSALSFVPTSTTARRLADHRLVFRSRNAGFQLYAQHNVDAGDVLLAPVPDGTTFHFAIRLLDGGFLVRYHPELTDAGPCLYLANLTPTGIVRATGALSRGATVEATDAVRLVPRRVMARVNLSADPAPTSFRVTDRRDASRIAASVPITATVVAVDLTHDVGTAYLAEARPGGTSAAQWFADDELAGRGAFGALELVMPPGPAPPTGHVFTAAFRRRN